MDGSKTRLRTLMKHKRGRAKNRRAGCLLCKPWKGNGMQRKKENVSFQESKGRIAEREQRREFDPR